LKASEKAQKGKRYVKSTLEFNINLEKKLFILQEELKSKTYKHGKYKDFIVEDSKKRLISAAPYRDRVVHHALMNVIEPLFERSFIYDTYACRKGKGTHAALRRFRDFLKSSKYVLKCDIRKYFPSIDHKILFGKFTHKIVDEDTLWLINEIINSYSVEEGNPIYFRGDTLFTPFDRKRGIPIGNLTSQFFANFYLSDFDHWIKEDLRAGPYVRYVDDFCVFGDDKKRLNDIKLAMSEYLAGLRLSLHTDKSRVYTLKEGVEFLGFRHLPYTMKVRKENVKRFRKRMRRYQIKYSRGGVSLSQIKNSIVSWEAHASYGDSYNLRNKIIPSFVFVRGECPKKMCSRVVRGGSWNNNNPNNLRASNRNRNEPDNRNNNVGFRCSRD
jgi:retron-type reverse transcriptase